jgi:flagellar motor switch protein FliM
VSEVLSPDAIAALVAAAKEGTVPERDTERHRRARRVRDFDFTRPIKLAPDQQRRVEKAHESFCRSTATRLSAELRSAVEFEVINVDQVTWANALGDVPQPSMFCPVGTRPIDTTILFCIEQGLLFRMIERLIGGGGVGDAPVRRELTEIELALTRRAVATMLEQLTLDWNDLFGLQLELLGLESQVANVQLAPASEPTIVITVEVRGLGGSSTMSLLVPYRSISPVAGRLQAQFGDADRPTADAATARIVHASVGGVDVEVQAEVAAVELTLGYVLSLAPGDVLRLGSAIGAGVTLCTGGVPLHYCKPGRRGERRAVEIVRRVEDAA